MTLLFFSTFSQARVSSENAKRIFDRIKNVLVHEIDRRNIDIRYSEIENKPIPGAFSKWIKVNKIASIKLTNSLLDIVDERVLSVYLCHEFGHFLGGAPFVLGKPSVGIHSFRNPFKYMSVEGQSDYFAANSCLIPVFKEMKWQDESLDQDFLYECILHNEEQTLCNGVLNSITKTMSSYS